MDIDCYFCLVSIPNTFALKIDGPRRIGLWILQALQENRGRQLNGAHFIRVETPQHSAPCRPAPALTSKNILQDLRACSPEQINLHLFSLPRGFATLILLSKTSKKNGLLCNLSFWFGRRLFVLLRAHAGLGHALQVPCGNARRLANPPRETDIVNGKQTNCWSCTSTSLELTMRRAYIEQWTQ